MNSETMQIGKPQGIYIQIRQGKNPCRSKTLTVYGGKFEDVLGRVRSAFPGAVVSKSRRRAVSSPT